MEHFVTLFDSLFLPQGLALQISMQRHAGEHTLWIICMDDVAHSVLERLNLNNVRLLHLDHLETSELKRVKPLRSTVEYCWTMTPFAPRFVFESDPTVERVTYLDADMWFRRNPINVFRDFERSLKAVLITDHAYSPENDQSALSGQYCVQFMTFIRARSEEVRSHWEGECIDWCYNRTDEGRFGDQKYLDKWPVMFGTLVHELADKELLMAPWNAQRYPYGKSVAWHFHGFRVITLFNSLLFFSLGTYPLPRVVKNNIYRQYMSDILIAIEKLNSIQFKIKSQSMTPLRTIIKSLILPIYFRISLITTNMLYYQRAKK